jgi:F-type H+-transporting ATPase subunit delta
MKGVSPLVVNLVLMLISKGRLDIIGEIAGEYQRLVKSSQGIEVAEVITAVPLAKEDEHKLARQLGHMVGKQIEIKSDINPDIVGGFTARIGDRLLDGSVRGKLAALKKELAGAGR